MSSTSAPNRWLIDLRPSIKRASFDAVALNNGEILVSGGADPNDFTSLETASCEIYSPMSRKWRAVADMQVPRNRLTVTTLQDGKSVLAVGSGDRIDSYTAEIYDIELDRWIFVPDFMNTGRADHTATLLQNGQVLFVGGYARQFNSYTSSVQLYVPSLNTFITTGSLNIDRYQHTATLLDDGLSVLVIGGIQYTSVKLTVSRDLHSRFVVL